MRFVTDGASSLPLLKLLEEERFISCASSSELEGLDGSDPFVSIRGGRLTMLKLAFLVELEAYFDLCKKVKNINININM